MSSLATFPKVNRTSPFQMKNQSLAIFQALNTTYSVSSSFNPKDQSLKEHYIIESLLRAFKTSCSNLATSLTLDFPSASLKSSTYVTSPTTWDIQRENTKRTKEFKSPSLQITAGLGNTATDGDVPIDQQPAQTNIPPDNTMPFWAVTETPKGQGQKNKNKNSKKQKHNYIKPGNFKIQIKRLQRDQFSNKFHSRQLRCLSCPLTFQNIFFGNSVFHKVKHWNIFHWY